MSHERPNTENSPFGGMLPKLDVYDMIRAMTDQMAGLAWQKMGLQPDPFTGKVEQDLPQAKVAIDVATGLAGFLKDCLDEDDKREIDNLVRDLRINYVQRAQTSSDQPSVEQSDQGKSE